MNKKFSRPRGRKPLLCLAVSLLVAAAAPGAEFSAAAQAYWSFDEETGPGETVRDAGPQKFDGSIRSNNGTVPRLVPGIKGRALYFPSGHESWMEVDRGFRLRPPFTLAVWVKLDSRRNTMELLGQKAHSWKEGMRLVFSARQFAFEYGDGVENIVVRFDPHQTNPGQWVFLAVVHDGEEISLYVDGEPVRREKARPAKWSDRPMFFGNYVNQKDAYRFVGTMDEIVILEEALDGPALCKLGQSILEKGR